MRGATGRPASIGAGAWAVVVADVVLVVAHRRTLRAEVAAVLVGLGLVLAVAVHVL